MRRTVLVIMLAALAACSDEGAGTTDASTAELQAANAAYDRALVAGDAAALARIYTDDFTIIDDDGAIHDKQNQIDFMTTKVDLLEAQGDEIQVTPLGADAALVTGRFRGRYRMDGKENKFTERYTSVWVRDGGEWKVRHEHASLVPKPKPAAAALFSTCGRCVLDIS